MCVWEFQSLRTEQYWYWQNDDIQNIFYFLVSNFDDHRRVGLRIPNKFILKLKEKGKKGSIGSSFYHFNKLRGLKEGLKIKPMRLPHKETVKLYLYKFDLWLVNKFHFHIARIIERRQRMSTGKKQKSRILLDSENYIVLELSWLILSYRILYYVCLSISVFSLLNE